MNVNERASMLVRAMLFSLVAIGGPTAFMGLTTYGLTLASGAIFSKFQAPALVPTETLCSYPHSAPRTEPDPPAVVRAPALPDPSTG